MESVSICGELISCLVSLGSVNTGTAEKMDTGMVNGESSDKGQESTTPSEEEAAKEAKKLAKKILNETARIDPSRLPQDTGRTRRKVLYKCLS